MKINNLMSLALILSGFTIANSAHAMLRHTLNRSGTKYGTQVAQTVQRRFIHSDDVDRIAKSLENIANELKKNNANIESLVKKVDALERIETLMFNTAKSYFYWNRKPKTPGNEGQWEWLFKK